jgi:uncharacterized tellurite resistance protein B-like protein
MFDFLKKILLPSEEKQETIKVGSGRKLQIATCALFIELAKADSSFDDIEREKIIRIMKRTFDLEEDYIHDLIELASEHVEKSISLYEFTPIINDSFSPAEKYELLKNLWRLVYIDNELDKYEEHLVKRIGKMLNVEYTEIIAARMQVKEELNL